MTEYRIKLMMMLMFQCLASCEVWRQFQEGIRVTLPVTCHCLLRDEADHPDIPQHTTSVKIKVKTLTCPFLT